MKVLIADDDDVLRHILKAKMPEWGFEAVTARNGLEAWKILQGSDAPRMAVLDHAMPGMDGIEICREIRQREFEPYVYLLILTSGQSKEDVIAGMEAGADDYIVKPFELQELKVRLHAGRRILDLQNELLAARETLRYQANHDPLTGLLNRSAILEALNTELARAVRMEGPVCLMLADIDHFKKINDNHGHTAGDAVLCEAARRMRSSVRSYDCVGRYGGEEFLFVVPGCGSADARGQAERLQADITGRPVVLPRASISFTISIGVVAAGNVAGLTSDALIQAADTALYQAKSEGGNRAVLFEGMLPCVWCPEHPPLRSRA